MAAWGVVAGEEEGRARGEAAVGRREAAGTEVVEVDTVCHEDPVVSWFGLTAVASYRTLRDYEGTPDWEGIDQGLREQMAYGKDHVAAPAVLGVMDLAHRLNVALVQLFHDAAYLLTPTFAGPTPAPAGSCPPH